MNLRVIGISGWVCAAGLLAMFLTAQSRLQNLRANMEREQPARTEAASTAPAPVQPRAMPAVVQARAPAPVPAPHLTTAVQVRELESLQGRLTRLMEGARLDAATRDPAPVTSVVAQPEQKLVSEPVAPVAQVTQAPAAPKNESFLASLDRMIADLDQRIESDRTAAEKKQSPALTPTAAPAPAQASPPVALAPVKPAPASPARRSAGPTRPPETQVIFVQPFGEQQSGTWVKYHRYEKTDNNQVKFYFGDREVFAAPADAVEWEERVLVN